jgi:hypothetical protein
MAAVYRLWARVLGASRDLSRRRHPDKGSLPSEGRLRYSLLFSRTTGKTKALVCRAITAGAGQASPGEVW